jgi:hypothetical protein
MDVWQKLQEAATRQNIIAILKDIGFHDSETAPLVADVYTALWWSQAMADYAQALHDGKSLVSAGKDVVQESNAGFNEPWLILACRGVLENPVVLSRFTSSALGVSLITKASGD